jgi:hypothetical protein
LEVARACTLWMSAVGWGLGERPRLNLLLVDVQRALFARVGDKWIGK